MQEEQVRYYRDRSEEAQRKIVNYKSCSTATSESFIWTYRTTAVDVISLVTTTVAIRRGAMEDILLKPRNVKRIKPISKGKRVTQLGDSPFDSIMSVDLRTRKKKMNQILLSEKNKFMHRLHSTRSWRVKLEAKAATRIQALYRGHFVRMSAANLRQSSKISKQVRSNILSYLASQHNIHISLSKYKNGLPRVRNISAATIQTAYFRYLSRKYLRRRRYDALLKRRLSAVVRIQRTVRGVAARERVKLFVERMRMVHVMRAVLKIQTLVRKHLARRRVRLRRLKLHHFASRLIQDWYRARFARKMAANIKAMLLFRKTKNGATAMQGIVRRFLAKRRVHRIRLRRLYVVLSRCATMIQCLMRRYLARVKVPRRRLLVNAARKEKLMLLEQQRARETREREASEQKSLLDSVDLFLQARQGNVVEVEDIYCGLVSADEHDPGEVDPKTGENLLSIAAQLGNLELVRKCLKWNFDMNFRNDVSGLSVFMVAAKYNQLPVMKYLLAPPFTADEGVDVTPLDTPLSEEDLGFLLVTSAANASLDDSMQMLKLVLSLEGVSVDFRNAVTGMTALHAACEVGHVEAFKLLLKEKADMEVEDDLSQTILHKASASSYKITELILGLDPSFPTYMSDQSRFEMVTKVDGDGKDSILHAALNGQAETLELLVDIAKKGAESSRGLTKGASTKGIAASTKQQSFKWGDQSADINWSSADISKALLLVERGNLLCLEKLADIGFDFSWADEDTGRTMAMVACQSGDLDSIDLVMSHGADFSAADRGGRTAVHYAALCTKQEGLIPHLLTHQHASKCKVSDKGLLATDNEGDNVYHLSVRANYLLNIDLLAQSVMSEALEMKNRAGMTPLLLACSLYRLELVKGLLLIGADALQVDSNRRSCLWHLYHPQKGAVPAASHRSVCSEFKRQNNPNMTRREVESDALRVGSEISVVQALLQAGCSLYDNYRVTPEAIIMALTPTIDDQVPMEETSNHSYHQPGDIAVQELSFTLFKTIFFGRLVTKSDAWRLLLSAIWFDDGSLKTLAILLKEGLLDVLLLDEEDDVDSNASSGISTDGIVGKETASSLSKLQRAFFMNLTAAGWAIRLNRPQVLQFAVCKPYDPSVPVDIYGNPALHLVAMYGTSEMVDIVLSDKTTRIEHCNVQGLTAGMVAARCKNLPVLRNLFHRGADARRWLGVGCSAWVLAFVRRKERFEKNLQTGRCGDDDDRYFGLGADPFYSMWWYA